MTVVAETQGVLLRGWPGDPRLSPAQIRALDQVAAADPAARILGLDFGHRPVVSARLGVPPAVRVYALLRNGDPCDPKGDDAFDPYREGPTAPRPFLREPWG